MPFLLRRVKLQTVMIEMIIGTHWQMNCELTLVIGLN